LRAQRQRCPLLALSRPLMPTMSMSASGDKADIPDPLSNVC
jgi:hypothetical protein